MAPLAIALVVVVVFIAQWFAMRDGDWRS